MIFKKKNKDYEMKSTGGGISFVGLLQVAFIVLKLCHVIDWSWFWVLSPAWISAAVIILMLLFIFIVALIFD